MERRRGFVNELDLKITEPIYQFVFFLPRTFNTFISLMFSFSLFQTFAKKKKDKKKQQKKTKSDRNLPKKKHFTFQ